MDQSQLLLYGPKPTIPRQLPEKLLQPLKPAQPPPSNRDRPTSRSLGLAQAGGTRGSAVPGGTAGLTDEDETSRLEELLVAPGGMLPFQYVADAVVLAQPERGVQAESRQQPEHLLPYRQLLLLGGGRWVDHVNRSIGDHGGVHLTIHHLGETRPGWQKGRRGENHPSEPGTCLPVVTAAALRQAR